MVSEFMSGVTVPNFRVNFRIIKCMVSEFMSGVTVPNFRVNFRMIKEPHREK